jgi:hypothetical protein
VSSSRPSRRPGIQHANSAHPERTAAHGAARVEEKLTFEATPAASNLAKSICWQWVDAGGRRATSNGARPPALRVDRRSRRPARSRCRPRSPSASASCASGPAGAPAAWPRMPTSRGRTRRFTGCCAAAAARAARAPSGRRWSATSGPVSETCCTRRPSPPSPAGRSTGSSSGHGGRAPNVGQDSQNRSFKAPLRRRAIHHLSPVPTPRAPTARSSASTRH